MGIYGFLSIGTKKNNPLTNPTIIASPSPQQRRYETSITLLTDINALHPLDRLLYITANQTAAGM